MKTFLTFLQLSALARSATSVVATALLSIGSVAAQNVAYYPAVTKDLSASGALSVSGAANTGCEVVFAGSSLLKVFTWDDVNTAYLAWDLGGTKGKAKVLGGPASDPDVVVDPIKGNILVTYLSGGDAYYEVRHLDAAGTALTTVVTATRLNTGGFGLCANPNVDVANNGEAVMVWEQAGIIYARSYNMGTSAAAAGGLYRVSSNQPGFTFSQPDVSVNRNTNNGTASTLVVPSFVFVATNTSTFAQTIRMTQPPMTNVRNGSTTGAVGADIYTGSGAVETPRISATHNYGFFGSYDFEVVLTDLDGAGNKIIGLNRTSATTPITAGTTVPSTVLNNAGNGTTPLYGLATCERPVVTYAADAILVAWTLLDGGSVPPTLKGDKEVLQVRLSYTTGAVQNYNQNNGDGYAIVDYNLAGDQYLPSVAGRLTSFTLSGTATNDALYAFFDEAAGDVLYKSSAYSNVNLRPAANGTKSGSAPAGTALLSRNSGAGAASGLEVYPNPCHGTATFALGLREGEQARSLEVYSNTGQRVSTVALPTELGATVAFDAAAAGLKPGLYLVRLTTSQGTQNLRLQYE